MLSVSQQNFTLEVLESPQPVLVNFWAPWCGLCLMLNPTLTKLESEWQGQLKLVSINADQNFKLVNTYRLRSLPTLMLFEGGSIVHRFEGFRGREDLYHNVNRVMLTFTTQSA
jgi:thioredoxin 1